MAKTAKRLRRLAIKDLSMKILFLSDLWDPFPGGAERYIVNVARELRDKGRGHQVLALSSYELAKPTHGIEVIVDEELGRHTTILKLLRDDLLRQHLATLKPDAIVTHRFFAQEYKQVLEESGIRLVEVVHQHKHLNAHVTVFNSEYTKQQNPHKPEDLVILPTARHDEVHVEQPGTKIGMVKPLEGKGIHTFYSLCDAFPKRQFVILRGEWQAIEVIQHKPNVEFINPVRSMSEFYSKCRVVLVPSLSEDAGTIPLEAAWAGIPCIASRTMGLIETNKGGRFPSHPYLECWVEEINRLDQKPAYAATVERQLEFIKSYPWNAKFAELRRIIGE
jgi:glycosyltransferase involved in cell wall biosynthesis